MKKSPDRSSFNWRRKIIDVVPIGIAAGPFEAAVAVGYFATVVQVLTNSKERSLLSFELFPGGGLTLWLVTALVAAVITVLGQLLISTRTRLGLNLERLGLLGIAAIIASYIWLLWAHLGRGSVAVETNGATLVACLYKILTIGAALDGLSESSSRKEKD